MAKEQNNAVPSDAGPVAARRGFEYQDHVAAHYVIQMLDDPQLLHVECETQDDITLSKNINGIPYIEYIQVKTTEKDAKWSLSEISKGEKGKAHSSLIEKSLLCDKGIQPCHFCIVSKRDLRGELALLKLPIDHINRTPTIDALATKIHAKHKTTKSANKNDLIYWVKNATWNVMADMDSIEFKNLHKLSELAYKQGASINHSHLKDIYKDLLDKVWTAATHSNITHPNEKIITNSQAKSWWSIHLQKVHEEAAKKVKPFKSTKAPAFLIELHSVNEDGIKRFMSGYDVQYELKKWRTEDFAKYLKKLLPELALKTSELAQVNHFNADEKIKSSVQKLISEGISTEKRLLPEVMLHGILRFFFESEPTSCKLFNKSSSGKILSWNAHIVHSVKGDEIWLGHSYLISKSSFDEQVSAIIKQIDAVLDADLLKEERQIILSLREPNHLLSSTIEKALESHTPIDQLMSALCIPVLIAYDSAALSDGHKENYQEALKKRNCDAL